MESEPPVSEACDDEGDESAPADDDMTFIDDASLELPDVAAEGEAEGGGSQSQYRQQSQESESEQGSQSSQCNPLRACSASKQEERQARVARV